MAARETSGRELAVIGAIAVGGMLGAAARHAVSLGMPTRDGFPWGTFTANASGCLLIGVLMVVILETGTPHPLARPLLGVGVLGGYTTFSTYAVEVHALVLDDRAALAAAYLVGTVVAALVAVQVGVVAARALVASRPRIDSNERPGGIG
jgi:fluoride exporter